jgi:hypothetical protein
MSKGIINWRILNRSICACTCVWGRSLSPSICGLKELSHVLIPKNRSTSKRFIIGNSFVVRFPRQFPELLIPHGLCDLSPFSLPSRKRGRIWVLYFSHQGNTGGEETTHKRREESKCTRRAPEKRIQLNILKLVKKNAGLIICHKGNGLASVVGTWDHGLERFDFSNPFPLENGGTPHPPLLFPATSAASLHPAGYPPKFDTSQRVPDHGWWATNRWARTGYPFT